MENQGEEVSKGRRVEHPQGQERDVNGMVSVAKERNVFQKKEKAELPLRK